MDVQRQCNNSINRIHERTLRIAYNDYISPFESLLEKDDSVTIHQRNILTLALEIFKTENGLNPSFIKNIFWPTQHNYNTRNKGFAHPNPRTVTYGIESFGYKATHIKPVCIYITVDSFKTFLLYIYIYIYIYLLRF